MQTEPQVTFRGMDPSPAIEARVREAMDKLGQFHNRITSCRVVVEAPHRRRTKGKLYTIRIDMTLPGKEIVVTREGRLNHAHEDVYVALRDAFDAARRQLENHAREQRGQTKWHEAPPHGTVSGLFPDHGFITTADGREIYFHRNSVVGDGFESLEVGNSVRFAESVGDKGPQASTVHPLGKHHIVEPDWSGRR
jgi:ribosomal subunit interface protein